MRSYVLAAVVAGGLAPVCGLAQTQVQPLPPNAPAGQQNMMNTMQLAAHNQLGVLEYCQAQGSVGSDVVALQQRIIGMMPPGQVDGLDQAEASGKAGNVVFAGNTVAISDAAKARSTTTDAMCKQIGSMLTAQASSLPH